MMLLVQTLSQQFPESDWIVAQAAVAQYNLRNFDDAQELFEELIERDPHRVEVSPAWQLIGRDQACCLSSAIIFCMGKV